MAIQTVGLLSPGDMGHVVGQVLLQHGMRVVTCLQGRSERTRMLSRQAGIAEVPTYEQLVREADLFFCESPFLEEDVEQASKRYHLTARQAGLLGRDARVRRLEVFHFSPRYEGRADEIYAEARSAFLGG